MVKHQKRASSVDKWGSVLSCPSADHSCHRYQFICLIKISYCETAVFISQKLIIRKHHHNTHQHLFYRWSGLKHLQIGFFRGVKLTNQIVTKCNQLVTAISKFQFFSPICYYKTNNIFALFFFSIVVKLFHKSRNTITIKHLQK